MKRKVKAIRQFSAEEVTEILALVTTMEESILELGVGIDRVQQGLTDGTMHPAHAANALAKLRREYL